MQGPGFLPRCVASGWPAQTDPLMQMDGMLMTNLSRVSSAQWDAEKTLLSIEANSSLILGIETNIEIPALEKIQGKVGAF